MYSKIAGMADEYLSSCISMALNQFSGMIPTALPTALQHALRLPEIRQAIAEIHNPTSMQTLLAAKRRFNMEELYFFAVMMNYSASKFSSKTKYIAKKCNLFNQIISSLPYHLTTDQEKTVISIKGSMQKGETVHAMVQGDVGCGKSIVAFLAAVLMAENGYQVALVAPTAVLAQQHYADLQKLLLGTDIRAELVPSLSALKKKDRDFLLKRIKSNESKILVGTHALLSDQIEFSELALVITDEEHKFGIEQREKLVNKNRSDIHYITMSATPIPRSLATVLYGNYTQLHLIQSMPPGRKPVNTAISKILKGCFKFIRQQIDSNRQIYVVCPQIETSASTEGISSVSDLQKIYSKAFGEDTVLALTGKNTKGRL